MYNLVRSLSIIHILLFIQKIIHSQIKCLPQIKKGDLKYLCSRRVCAILKEEKILIILKLCRVELGLELAATGMEE